MIRRLVSLNSKLFTIRALVSLLFDRDDYLQSSAPFSPPNIFIFKTTGVNPPWEGDCSVAADSDRTNKPSPFNPSISGKAIATPEARTFSLRAV